MTKETTTTSPAVRGRPFANGNGGRPRGSKNKSTLLLAALSDEDQEQLIAKGLQLAKAGDVAMLKFFLSRILPRERALTVHLPKMETADDAVEALGRIASEVGEGRITPVEAANVATLLNSYARAIDMADLVKTMEALAAKISGRV